MHKNESAKKVVDSIILYQSFVKGKDTPHEAAALVFDKMQVIDLF